MGEYSVDQIRVQAAKELRSGVHSKSYGMLLAYADLLEQIERAREGVTKLADKWYESENVSEAACGEALRDELQSVAHLLPSERGGVDYPECSGDPASCPENEGHGCCKANPPAQAAKVADPVAQGEAVSGINDVDLLRSICEDVTDMHPSVREQLRALASRIEQGAIIGITRCRRCGEKEAEVAVHSANLHTQPAEPDSEAEKS